MSSEEDAYQAKIFFYFFGVLGILFGVGLCVVHGIEYYRTYETTGTIVSTRETFRQDKKHTKFTLGKVRYIGNDNNEYFVSEEVPYLKGKGDEIKIRVYKSRPSKAFFVQEETKLHTGIFLIVLMSILTWNIEWFMKKIEEHERSKRRKFRGNAKNQMDPELKELEKLERQDRFEKKSEL